MSSAEARRKLRELLIKQREQKLITQEDFELQLEFVDGSTVPDQSPLATYLSEEAQFRRVPWKAAEKTALDTLNAIEKRVTENPRSVDAQLLEEFEKKLEKGNLTPFEVVLCEHLLYHPKMEVGARIFLSLILNTLPCDRLRLHNWGMARGLNPTQKDSFGPHIEDLQYPLLPPDFSEANINLLKASAAAKGLTLTGGSTGQVAGSAKAKIGKIFNLDDEVVVRNEDGLHQPTMSEEENILRGGAYKERILDQYGTQQLELEMGETEEKLNEIVALLRRQASQRRENPGARYQNARGYGYSHSKDVRPPCPQVRGRGRGGRVFEGAGAEDAYSKNE